MAEEPKATDGYIHGSVNEYIRRLRAALAPLAALAEARDGTGNPAHVILVKASGRHPELTLRHALEAAAALGAGAWRMTAADVAAAKANGARGEPTDAPTPYPQPVDKR